MTKDINSQISQLCRKAKEMGASAAIPVPAADIVVDERALLKCLVPVCAHYGVDLLCPPNVLPPSQFKAILGLYKKAILIKVDIPPGNHHSADDSGQPATPDPQYLNAAGEAKKKLHEIVCRIESMCISEEYHFAAGFIGGSCPLCEECVGAKSGLPCRHPFKARPAMEAMGIDVMATVKRAGISLGFGQDEGRSWIGLVLID